MSTRPRRRANASSAKTSAAKAGAASAAKPKRKATKKAPSTAEAPPRGRPDPAALEPLEADAGVAAFVASVAAGERWYPALLQVVARWIAPEERIDGTVYRYLIGGEAFDWLRLAERLLDAAGDLVPRDESERLLCDRLPPLGEDASEEAFARAIGHQKHRAHLNFVYGVTVEEALLLQAELELYKARQLDGPRGEPPDVAAYQQVYGQTFAELVAEYRIETGARLTGMISQSELRAFTYWCSKYRFRLSEPARVASDTRKALALLSRLEAERTPRERRIPDARAAVIDVPPPTERKRKAAGRTR